MPSKVGTPGKHLVAEPARVPFSWKATLLENTRFGSEVSGRSTFVNATKNWGKVYGTLGIGSWILSWCCQRRAKTWVKIPWKRCPREKDFWPYLRCRLRCNRTMVINACWSPVFFQVVIKAQRIFQGKSRQRGSWRIGRFFFRFLGHRKI